MALRLQLIKIGRNATCRTVNAYCDLAFDGVPNVVVELAALRNHWSCNGKMRQRIYVLNLLMYSHTAHVTIAARLLWIGCCSIIPFPSKCRSSCDSCIFWGLRSSLFRSSVFLLNTPFNHSVCRPKLPCWLTLNEKRRFGRRYVVFFFRFGFVLFLNTRLRYSSGHFYTY